MGIKARKKQRNESAKYKKEQKREINNKKGKIMCSDVPDVKTMKMTPSDLKCRGKRLKKLR